MIISISGMPGSGKTTVARILSERLGMKHYYIGDIRRKLAIKKGLTLEEFNKLGEKDPSTDILVDEYQKELGKREDDFIIEGRTSFHFIPHSIKIFLDVDPREGAKRIFKEVTENPEERNEPYDGVEDALRGIKKRIQSDKKRYKKYYDLDSYDKKHYDLIIDTTKSSPEEVSEKIIDFVNKKKNKRIYTTIK